MADDPPDPPREKYAPKPCARHPQYFSPNQPNYVELVDRPESEYRRVPTAGDILKVAAWEKRRGRWAGISRSIRSVVEGVSDPFEYGPKAPWSRRGLLFTVVYNEDVCEWESRTSWIVPSKSFTAGTSRSQTSDEDMSHQYKFLREMFLGEPKAYNPRSKRAVGSVDDRRNYGMAFNIHELIVSA